MLATVMTSALLGMFLFSKQRHEAASYKPPPVLRYLLDWEIAASPSPLCLGDVAFFVMASERCAHRQLAIRETWGRDLSPSDLRFVTEAADPEANTSGFLSASSYHNERDARFYAAQRRQVCSLARN